MKNFIKTMVILSFVASLSSCIPAVLGGGAVGSAAIQDRTIGTQIDDTTVWTRVKTALMSKQKGYSSISIVVRDGRVMLTGNVANTEEKLEVIKTTWSCKGVKEVVDEVLIKDPSENGVKTFAVDSWITTQVKSQMLMDKGVSSVNYSVETMGQVVYLFGRARTDAELKRVVEIAGTVKNVRKVVSYVKVMD